MDKERAARKACKQAICRLLLQRKSADGSATGTLTCDVVKTWLKSTIERKILRGKLSWPWENAQCKTRLRLDRAALASARAPGKHTIKLAKHVIACSLDRGAGKRFDVSLAVAPEVTFTGGKATAVAMHWSDIKAPTLAKGVIWSGTKLDNALGVLEGSMIDAIGHFLDVSCKEVGVGTER